MAGGGAEETLVDRIYEASVVPELWPGVLEGLVELSRTAWSTLVSVRSGAAQWVTSSPAADEIVDAHFKEFAANLRTTRLLARRHPGFITDYDILGQAEIDAEPVYRDFLIPRGYGFGVGTNIFTADGDTLVVHCEGHFAAGAIGRETVSRLDALRPHLARSALVASRLAFERARSAVETLSGLGLAACAVHRSGSVLVANIQFEATQPTWTTRGANRIALSDRRADRQLYETLAQIDSGEGVRSLPISGLDGHPPAVLHIIPIRRSARELFSRATAILVLTFGSNASVENTPLLQALFDLTAKEADVAARIAAGETVTSMARTDGRSAETVRNQLKSVLAKTGCSRQADLARLFAQLIPGRR